MEIDELNFFFLFKNIILILPCMLRNSPVNVSTRNSVRRSHISPSSWLPEICLSCDIDCDSWSSTHTMRRNKIDVCLVLQITGTQWRETKVLEQSKPTAIHHLLFFLKQKNKIHCQWELLIDMDPATPNIYTVVNATLSGLQATPTCTVSPLAPHNLEKGRVWVRSTKRAKKEFCLHEILNEVYL